jgi:hypothetical protein
VWRNLKGLTMGVSMMRAKDIYLKNVNQAPNMIIIKKNQPTSENKRH